MEDQIERWLRLMGGRGSEGPEGRARAVREMRALGTEVAFSQIAERLSNPDPESRCAAIVALLLLDAHRAVEVVTAMLADPDVTVRWHACGCLHDFGDERAVPAIAEVLRRDPDPMVRGTAAYALGGIGSPAGIPALLTALGSDNEYDQLGHSPSWCAATALDDILGTNETRVRVSESLRMLRAGKPDLDLLRQLAVDRFQQWSRDRAESGAAESPNGDDNSDKEPDT